MAGRSEGTRPPVCSAGRDGLSRYAKLGKCRDFKHFPTPACNCRIILVYHVLLRLGRNWVESSAGERPGRQKRCQVKEARRGHGTWSLFFES